MSNAAPNQKSALARRRLWTIVYIAFPIVVCVVAASAGQWAPFVLLAAVAAYVPITLKFMRAIRQAREMSAAPSSDLASPTASDEPRASG